MAPIKKIARTTLADEVVAQIRQAIVSGDLAFGEALSEPSLAKRFGVSRAPIREALVALEREGLVQFEPSGRTRVIEICREDFEQISSLRAAYERLAGSRVAERWNDRLAAELEDNLQRQRRSKTHGELSALDMDFHEIVVRAADHPRLLHAWRPLRMQSEACLVHYFELEKKLGYEPRDVTVQAHEQLVEALSSGDPDRAADAMAKHAESWMKWEAEA